MGKASAKKKARRVSQAENHGKPSGPMPGVHEIDVIKKLYRFFDCEEHAEQFLRGDIYITTLECCQNLTNPGQGDAGEGTMSYTMTSTGFDSNNPEHLNRARLAGMNLPQGIEGVDFSSTRSQSTKNCYVLCMTKEFSPEIFAEDFGRHCVEISQPAIFFDMINAAMGQDNMFKVAEAASILYVDRDYSQENVPVNYPVGFVKPPDLYKSQKEFRFLWTVEFPDTIKPFSLQVPRVSHLLKKLVIPHPTDRIELINS